MTSVWAWVIELVAVLFATVFATADSALLAFHASESSTASEHAFAERERLHRALSMGRVVAYVAAGASLSQALHLAAMQILGDDSRGDGDPGAYAGASASNPLPWWEKLTLDVSLWVRFTATERREGAPPTGY